MVILGIFLSKKHSQEKTWKLMLNFLTSSQELWPLDKDADHWVTTEHMRSSVCFCKDNPHFLK